MKKLSTLLIALCLIVTLAVSASAANILGVQGDKGGGVIDWVPGQNSHILYRTNSWTNNAVSVSYFGLDKPGARVGMPAGCPVWQSVNVHNFDALGTEVKFDLTNGFKVSVEDIVWDANTNAAIAITIGNDTRTNLTTDGGLTLVVRKDGTVALYNNKSGNWYGETATHFDAAALVAGATSFTYSMEKIEGGYKFYVNDTLLATFDAGNAAAWPADLTDSLTELGFNFLGMNGTLAENTAGTMPGPLTYSVVAIDDMSDPEPDPTPESVTINGDTSKDVTANYVAGQTSEPVYMVDISWGSMTFTYTAASTGTWNPTTHTYDGVTAAKWTCAENANKITVTNHSNAAVTATITESNVTEGITFAWDKTTLELATADNGENGAAGTPTTASALLTVSGTLTASEELETIGTVTVTLET